jgi:hypothetical protein
MTMDNDNRIDEAVRRASARRVDEALLARNVVARIRQDGKPTASPWLRFFALPQFSGPGRLAPAGFAAILLATPFAVANYPGDATENVIYALALGDPVLITAPETPFVGSGLFE